MRREEALRFELFGESFELVVSRSDVLAEVRERLPPLASSSGPVAPRARYVVSASSSSGLEVRRGKGRPAHAECPAAAADLVAEDIQHVLAHRARELLFLHAGAVAWQGRAIVLPGRSGCGKSRLVAELLAAGAGYVSDELAVIDSRGRVHPYARPVALRQGRGVERIPAQEWRAAVPAKPVEASAFFFLRYRPGQPWTVERLTPGQAVLAALRHALAARRRLELARRILVPLSRRTPAFRGSRGEAAAAVSGVLEAVERA